jgi:hypothetical protein
VLRESHCIIIAAVTFRQAAGTGYVFGAYTAVDWPNRPARGTPAVNVSDPSGSSFLFSLTNKYDRPFRMSLIDCECALCVHPTAGPMFGADVKDAVGKLVNCCNLYLMLHGKAANESRGNWSSNHSDGENAYQLDEWAGAPPIDFNPNWYTLAGQRVFAAAEIEVYSM